MSSTSTEVQTVAKKSMVFDHPRHKMEDKRLVRTSSLEKIRRFNNYICSQQYYILPALLAWLRSSQSVLQSSTETTIFFFRSLIFNNFVYKLYQFEFKALVANVSLLISKQILKTYNSVESVYLLKTAVYLTAFILASELCLCFYLLSNTHIPLGLVFLIVSWFYVIYLNVRSTFSLKVKRKRDVRNKKTD